MSLEEIDMTSVDTEFSNEVIKESYSTIVKKLPTTEKILPNSSIKLKAESNYEMDIDFKIPKEPSFEYIESYPSNSFILIF